jgi:hypothetical protein
MCLDRHMVACSAVALCAGKASDVGLRATVGYRRDDQ